MGTQSRNAGDTTSPFLVTEHGNLSVPDGVGVVHSSVDDSPATGVLVLSTAVAVCGSYTYGAAVGYTSPAESGIMADLDLTLAEVHYSVAK